MLARHGGGTPRSPRLGILPEKGAKVVHVGTALPMLVSWARVEVNLDDSGCDFLDDWRITILPITSRETGRSSTVRLMGLLWVLARFVRESQP
jgi:hypothetical protein